MQCIFHTKTCTNLQVLDMYFHNQHALMSNSKKLSAIFQGDFSPRPVDLRGVNLTRSMLEQAEHLAESAHDVWAKRKKLELDNLGKLLMRIYLLLFKKNYSVTLLT